MQGYNNSTMASNGSDVKTAEQWAAYIAGGRAKDSRPVANNTSARLLPGGSVAIRLHNTDIVTISPEGIYTLNSGGWLTVTTKERINRYSPARISQRAGIWYMQGGSLFTDGIQVNAAGDPLTKTDPAKYEKKLTALKKQARQYARDYVTQLQAGAVGYPSAGDCWGCYFALSGSEQIPESSRNNAQPFGTSHLYDHMTEKYYVPSLLVNAGRAAGYRDNQVGMMGIGGHRVFIDPENVIYKYLVKTLQGDL